MTIDNLFHGTTASTSARELAGTAQLTSQATTLATTLLNVLANNADQEQYVELFEASKSDAAAQEKLIDLCTTIVDEDVEWLNKISDEDIAGMLKSQQSKRSRCKSKEMTADNYKSMMTAAIAERILRMATGKTKGRGGNRSTTDIKTAEELEALKADQEALKREIRNVQSKKSIMKSKAGFSEDDEKWQVLLTIEEQLKSIRVGTTSKVVKVHTDETKEWLRELLAEVEPSTMKAAQLKELLTAIKDKAFPADEEEPVDNEHEVHNEEVTNEETPAEEAAQ